MEAKMFAMNPASAKAAESRVYPLIAKSISALGRQGWHASAIRFTPPSHLRGSGAGGEGGYMLGIRVQVPIGDARLGWSDGSGSSDRTPVGFTWSPASVGTVMLLSDMDDGSGTAVASFVQALRAGPAARDSARFQPVPESHRTLAAAVSAMVGASVCGTSSIAAERPRGG